MLISGFDCGDKWASWNLSKQWSGSIMLVVLVLMSSCTVVCSSAVLESGFLAFSIHVFLSPGKWAQCCCFHSCSCGPCGQVGKGLLGEHGGHKRYGFQVG